MCLLSPPHPCPDESALISQLLESEPHPDYIRSINLTSLHDSINSILKESGWSFHLLSVACLSLAAIMEELHVPSLLHLHTASIFDPTTILRMELLVLATLNWRLRSVTPFDYLHHFISILPSFDHSVASDIILNTIHGKTKTRIAFFNCRLLVINVDLNCAEKVKSCHQLLVGHVSGRGQSRAGVLDAAACADHSENPSCSDSEIKRPRLSAQDVQESL
ncbi:hypothetical protein SASPL_118481 [Salvia splendens]|uniref:Cyclin N-terminal domain-containing protein n=1 Tax=Salvia splendens TaxID=180675 RepID=A0A8X8Y2F3_SALSN|nr:hypothetical protein SASPL_118481 [Salvia splendens]